MKPMPARVWALLAAVTAAMLLLPTWVPSIWLRMAAIELLAAAAVLRWVPLPWTTLLRPRVSTVLAGLGGAALLWLAGAAVTWLLRGTAWLAGADAIDGWADALPGPALALALPCIVLAEDVVWRGAVTHVLATQLRWPAAALAAGAWFALAHVTSGPPVLWLAALGCGTLWSAIALRTGTLAPVFAMHLGWDVLVLVVAPYPLR